MRAMKAAFPGPVRTKQAFFSLYSLFPSPTHESTSRKEKMQEKRNLNQSKHSQLKNQWEFFLALSLSLIFIFIFIFFEYKSFLHHSLFILGNDAAPT